MVKLYGVLSGGDLQDPFGIRRGCFSSEPSEELLNDLESLPKGTRVGIEWFTEEDNDFVKSYPAELCRKHKVDFEWAKESSGYWDQMIDFLAEMGHEVVFLENRDIWSRYLDQFALHAKAKQKKFVRRKNESRERYHRKLCNYNFRGYSTEKRAQYIHQIERDESLLKAIIDSDVGVAIVSKGHSDQWFRNSEAIKEKNGLTIDSYAADLPIKGAVTRHSTFVPCELKRSEQLSKNEEDHPTDANIHLERVIRFLDTGSFSDSEPDYVGIWDVPNPYHGYFEMFITSKQDDTLIGRLVDGLGEASFDGEMTDEGFAFTKTYEEDSSGNAIKPPIPYIARRVGDEFAGYFFTKSIFGPGGFGSAFYLKKAQKDDPIDMSVRWTKLKGQVDSFTDEELADNCHTSRFFRDRAS
jgi:hypothetical protein